MNKKSIVIVIDVISLIIIIGFGITHSLQAHQSHSAKDQTAVAASPSRVENRSLYSPLLKKQWHYRVYLPANYQRLKAQGQRFASIYMLHGTNGDQTDFTTKSQTKHFLDKLVKKFNEPVIVVFPSAEDSFYLNTKTQPYEQAIMRELIPKITKTYQTAGGNKRAIGGLSMGGYGAARLLFRHPNQFSVGIMLSPAVWQVATPHIKANPTIAGWRQNGSFSTTLYNASKPTRFVKSYLQKANPPAALYVESSKYDTHVPIKNVNYFVKRLRQDGLTVNYQVDNFGGHSWTYWDQILPQAYQFAFQQFNKATH